MLPPAQSVLDFLRQSTASLDQGALRTRLAQLGFGAERRHLPSAVLSAGERLKAALAGVLYADKLVQLLLLDEPSNHLDLATLTALETRLRQYRGPLLVASHDRVFLEHVGIDAELRLDFAHRT